MELALLLAGIAVVLCLLSGSLRPLLLIAIGVLTLLVAGIFSSPGHPNEVVWGIGAVLALWAMFGRVGPRRH